MTETDTSDSGMTVAIDPRHMSAQQFTKLGMSQVAYVKPVFLNGSRAFSIHSADGTPMAVAGEESVAFAAIEQHEMVAARVH